MSIRSFLKHAYGRRRRAACLQSQRQNVELRSVDCLEKRLVMAIDVVESPIQSPENPSPADFLAVLVNQGTDCYVQMGVDELRIADNAGFVGAKYIPDVGSLTSIGFYSGQIGERSVSFGNDSSRYGLPDDYPGSGNLLDVLTFVLPTSQAPDQTSSISGFFDLGDGLGRVEFDNNGSGLPQVIGSGASSYEIAFLSGPVKQRLALRLTGGQKFSPAVGSLKSPELQMSYRYLVRGNTGGGGNVSLVGTSANGGFVSNPSGTTVFKIANETTHRIAPGTVSGQIAVNYQGPNTLDFYSSGGGQAISPLAFGSGRTAEARLGDLRITGEVDVTTGELTLRTSFIPETQGQGGAQQNQDPVSQGVSVWLERVKMGLSDLDGTNDTADPFGTTFDGEANKFTLFPGHDFTRGLTVSLRNVGSAIAIQSPLLAASAGEEVSLSANEVRISAPVRAAGGFVVPSPDEAVFGAVTEELRVDAAVGAPVFDITLVDDEASDARTRSQFLVTQSGSMSGLVAVNETPPAEPNVADAFSVDVGGGDIVIEGQIAASRQSYTMSSGVGSELEGPYLFTTQSPLTLRDTGLIRGDDVVITLANDIFGENYEAFQSLVSSVSLQTDVERLRVQSGTRAGSSLALPFPYDLLINERDALVMDAVSASSGGISIKAGGSLDLFASIQSLGDVSLEAGAAFTVRSPVATSFGGIAIVGPTVSVQNSVRVLDGLQDERQTDISITATSGNLVVDDAVSGINRVSLEAFGVEAAVSGTGRVIGDIVEVDADGDVTIATEANYVSVRAGGAVAVDEASAAVFEVRQSPDVTIVAHGQDRLIPAGVSPALFADVFDTEQLVVSAPRGSIDVLHHGSGVLRLGDAEEILASNGGSNASVASMVAAGSVIIRSSQAGEILVADAPSAASAATAVRFATTEPLPARPLSRHTASTNPGVYPTTLVTRLGIDATDKSVAVLGGVLATDLRLGDRVLVKDGLENHVDGVTGLVDDDLVNGIYVIRGITFLSADEMQLSMARATSFDTTQELDGRQYVRVEDGSSDQEATLRGRVFVTEGFVNQGPDQEYATPLRITAIASRSGFVDATAATTSPLDATYDASNGTITSSDSRSILSESSYFDGVKLALGRRVLVRHAVDGDPASIGLYVVTQVGEAEKTQWELTRYKGVDENGSGEADAFFTGAVAISEGSLRTAISGFMFEVAYDSVNHSPLRYHEVSDFRGIEGEGNGTFLTEDFDDGIHYRTDIGLNSGSGEVIYEVTSDAGTNDAAGSLGKILRILHSNAAKGSAGGVAVPQSYKTQINAGVTQIDLMQELPVINLPVSLVPDTNLVIDGSNVSLNRDGGVVRSSAIGARMGPIRPSVASTARRLVRNAGVSSNLDEIHGIEIGPGGAGSVIGNLSIGGFGKGAAIRIAGASNVLVENVSIGSADSTGGDGGRKVLSNAYGIVVEQAAGGEGGSYTTVLDSTIVASAVAGVSIGTHANGVRLVGNAIGSEVAANSVGVLIDSGESGLNAIGVQRVLPTAAISGLPVRPTGSATVSVAKNSLTDIFESGLQFYERKSNRLWTVANKALDPLDSNSYLLSLEGPLLQGGDASAEIQVEAGYFARVVARSERITLPAGVDPSRLYLGQSVTSTVEGALLNGTRISSITPSADGTTVIGISRPVAITAQTAILLEEPGRNVISQNDYGIVLKSGSSKILATDVRQSTYDGIRLDGVALDGSHQIGGASGAVLSLENVAVHSNGNSGINFTEAFFADLGVNAALGLKLGRASQVLIQGNLLGTNVDQDEGLSNGRQEYSNIVFDATTATDPSADVREQLIASTARDASSRYLARYRPEDNPDSVDELKEFESIDLEGNLHFSGNQATVVSGGGGFDGGGDSAEDDGWWNYLPTLR